MKEADLILKDIKNKQYKPIYFLMGEEAFYIDKIADYIEKNVLSEDEKGFNQMSLYGRDTTVDEIIGNAKRFPMMADYQVILVKEAQELSRTIEQLAAYVENPQPSTILVICYKYKTLDKRKSLAKNLGKVGVLFESKKLYENQIGDWITSELAQTNHKIDPKAAVMLTEFLGTDLNKINNELDKLRIIIPQGTTITPDDIERNIGISKDYNVFEFRNAIGKRDMLKATQIANYFAQNPKDNPMVLITSQVFSFFTQIYQYHVTPNKSQASVAAALKINPFFVKDYELAAKNYPMKKVSRIVAALREIDLKSKGVGANNLSASELLKDLLIAIA